MGRAPLPPGSLKYRDIRGLLQSREGLNLGIFLLHLLRHKELLCVPTRERPQMAMSQMPWWEGLRGTSHTDSAAAGRRLEWVLTEWPLPLDWAWLTGWSMPRLRALGKDQNRRHCTSVDTESHFFRPRNTLTTRAERHPLWSNSLVENWMDNGNVGCLKRGGGGTKGWLTALNACVLTPHLRGCGSVPTAWFPLFPGGSE